MAVLKKKITLLRLCGRIILTVPLLLFVALIIMVLCDNEPELRENQTYPRRFMALTEYYSEQYKVPQSVIYAVMRIESNFNEKAVSPANAIGLMQVTHETYDWIYVMQGKAADGDTLTIPSYNIDAGVWLLSWLYRRFQNWETVYAAYNAGIGRVNNWLDDPEISQDGKLVNIPIEETRNYVRLVSKAEEAYRTLYNMEDTVSSDDKMTND